MSVCQSEVAGSNPVYRSMYEHISAYFLERPGYTMKMRMAYVNQELNFIMDIRDTIGTCQLQLVDTDLDVLLARVNETLGRSPYVQLP